MRNRRAWRHTGTQHSSCVQLSPDHHHLLLFLVSCVDCAPAQHSGVPLHGTDLSAAYISHRLQHYASQQHGGMLQARARAGVNSRPSPSPYVQCSDDDTSCTSRPHGDRYTTSLSDCWRCHPRGGERGSLLIPASPAAAVETFIV